LSSLAERVLFEVRFKHLLEPADFAARAAMRASTSVNTMRSSEQNSQVFAIVRPDSMINTNY
jgi:hypothetical protein